MTDEYELDYSDHCGRIERDGRSIEIQIYRGREREDASWILEIVDDLSGSSIVWDELFETDQEAYDCLMKEIEAQGLNKVIDEAPDAPMPD